MPSRPAQKNFLEFFKISDFGGKKRRFRGPLRGSIKKVAPIGFFLLVAKMRPKG